MKPPLAGSPISYELEGSGRAEGGLRLMLSRLWWSSLRPRGSWGVCTTQGCCHELDLYTAQQSALNLVIWICTVLMRHWARFSSFQRKNPQSLFCDHNLLPQTSAATFQKLTDRVIPRSVWMPEIKVQNILQPFKMNVHEGNALSGKMLEMQLFVENVYYEK